MEWILLHRLFFDWSTPTLPSHCINQAVISGNTVTTVKCKCQENWRECNLQVCFLLTFNQWDHVTSFTMKQKLICFLPLSYTVSLMILMFPTGHTTLWRNSDNNIQCNRSNISAFTAVVCMATVNCKWRSLRLCCHTTGGGNKTLFR